VKPIICVGHAALDFVYRIDAFPPAPTKVRSLEHIESGGGMAANAAAAIARLGAPVELWSRTGADAAGARIHAFLEADGVDVRFVKRYEGARSSTSAVIVDGKGTGSSSVSAITPCPWMRAGCRSSAWPAPRRC
jgi:sulfofructose kinase